MNQRMVKLLRDMMRAYALLWRKICRDPRSSAWELRRCSHLLSEAKRLRDLAHQYQKNPAHE